MKLKRDLVGIIVSICFLNSLIFSFFIFPHLVDRLNLAMRGDTYPEIAASLLQGNGFTSGPPTWMGGSLRRGPLYPLFLATVWRFTTYHNEAAVAIVQGLLNALTCFVIFRISLKVFDYRVAFLTAILFTFSPFALWYVPRISYGPLFMFLLAVFCLSIIKAVTENNIIWSFVGGVVLGLATLTQSVTIFLSAALLLSFVIINKSIKQSFKHCFIVTTAMLIIIFPWTLRNYKLTGRLIPVNTGAATQFLIGSYMVDNLPLFGTNPKYMGEKWIAKLYERKYEELRAKDPDKEEVIIEAEIDAYFQRLATETILSDPSKTLSKILKGFIYFWYLGESHKKSMGLLLMQIPVIPLALGGIYFCVIRNNRQSMLLIILIAYFTLVYSVISPYGRYSLPIMPYVFVLASYSLVQLWEKIQGYLYINHAKFV